MKISLLFLLMSVMILLSSCKSTFYQVYETSSDGNFDANSKTLVFENDECRVIYDLWNERGNIGFQFFNKTDENVYVDLGESFFIFNGIACDYYKNRVYSEGNGSNWQKRNKNLSIGTGINKGISYSEPRIICIPSKSSKMITEYVIMKEIYHDCNLLLYPSKSKIKSLTFSKENSPFVFSNRISYRLGEDQKLIEMDNEFYVTQITNYPEREVIYKAYPRFCGEKATRGMWYLREGEANEFYIKYTRIPYGWKH